MAGPKRPSSASSVESQLSTFSWQSSCFSSTSCSRPSSLENAIVKEYVDIFERPSTQMKTLPRKYKSPYANRSARHSKDRRYDKRPHLSPDTPLQSVRVSRRSAYQDCFPLQKASVQSRNVLSDVDLDKTDSADNSCLSSSSKRNTPASVPPGHVRYPLRSPHCSHTTYGTVPVFKRKVWVIRVTAYKNGTDTRPAKISAPTIQLLLERCTVKLELNMAARRVFLADGTEAFEPKDIPHDSDVYISTGEAFIDPLKNVKDNAFLRGKMAWTMKGLVLPNSDKRGRTQPVLSKRIKNLITEGCVRILVFANGSAKDGQEIVAMLDQMEQFLDLCTSKLSLGSSAKGIFDVNGEKIEDLRIIPLLDKRLQNSITPLRGPVWVTKGEGFSPTGVKTYIQGVLSALCQELKSSKTYAVQLEHFMNGLTNEVTQKEIFSMTEEELYTAHGEVNELIDELKTAIKDHKGQLSKLAPQLQAEREQHSTYMFRHIQEFPASALVPQGLHLKVYENGKDSGGTRIVISKKEMQNSSVHPSADVMQELLRTIREKIQCSVDFNHTGLRPSRLFDEKGQEIKNPLSLQNEQKIWFSYGEDFRPPAENILTLIFDRVIYTYVNGTRIISKAFVDPDVSLPGYESWHLCPSFPDNVPPTNLHTLHQPETVDVDSLFLQLKKDAQFVLYPSITIEVRSRTPAQKGKSAQVEPGRASALLPCNLWLITKGGMILSRAMPRICLAVGHPIKLKTGNGAFLEGYRLTLQKRERNNSAQLWGFGNKGSIFSKAFPEFILTYLKDLHVQEVPTQAADHTPGQAWPPSQQEDGKISSKEAWQNDVSHFNQQQVSEASVAQLSPTGGPGVARQLTVALVKNLTGKHPQAPAQRWAIKHEGTSKPRQWKKSEVDNPLWNKLTYMWPVLPNGEVNENFDWPIQGSLIPNSPPLEKPSGNPTDSYVPVKLKVLKNGDWDKDRACTIVGPNISSMLKKTGAPSSSKKQMKQKEKKVSSEEDHSIKVEKIEFQQFLQRCTMMMDLPSAARRLFHQNGDEIFHLRDVERDQLVYVSCGDHWIDPQLSAAERKKQLLLNNLGSDVSLIRHYCSLQSLDNLVLEVCGEIVAGAKLTVNHNVSVANEDDAASAIDEGKVAQTEESVQQNDTDDILDSHTRTHRRLDALFTGAKYHWEETPAHYDEDINVMPEDDLVKSHQQDNCGYKRKVTKLHASHRQQFEFVDGQIICSAAPGLALGVSGEEVHAGVEVILVDRRPDDINQQWKYVEDNRTFHLESNPDLVLAISTPKVYPGLKQTDTKYPRCSTILQKYKEYINGAANQKWCYVPSMKVLGAFFSDQLDKEITAANQASVCTFTITGAVELSQPGYSLMSPDGNENIMVCLPCARTMGGQRELKKVPADTMFFCASGIKDSKLSPLGPFKCLHVRNTDLSTSEAQNTLRCFEERLSSLASERATHTISREISAVGSQRALRFKAYKNGSGFQNGKLIIAGTLPMLLTMCTKELDLPRPASKLYTEDGTLILTWSNLILWAVNEFFQKNEEQNRSIDAEEDLQPMKERTELTLVGPEDLNMIDEHLLSFILRKPVEVWASCGEPFLSLHALQRSQEREKLHWLQKEKILTDLNGMKHKIRHLQGRRVKSLTPPRMVPNQNPSQPVLVEGGWTEETNEERKLLKNIHNAEMYLSDVQALHLKKPNVPSTTKESGQRALYTCPATKRVLVYLNGGNEEQAIFAWGKTMEEMLDNCTSRLNMQLHPAEAFYTPDGEKVTSWDDVIKDMVLCVSSGEPFVSYKAKKHMIQVKANYARIRRRYGSEATDVIVSSPKGMDSQLA